MKTQYWLVYHMIGGSSFESIDKFDSKKDIISLRNEQMSDGYGGISPEVNIVSGKITLLFEKIVAIEIKSQSYNDYF